MNDYKSLGQLAHPPLVYTMGVVMINLQSIKQYIEAIQDSLRDEYPGFSKVEVSVARHNPFGEREEDVIHHYVLNDPSAKWGVVLTSERLTFHTLDYKHFKDFGEKFKIVLDKFKEVTSLKFHSGLAFRQIDNIRVVEGKETSLSDCINDSYLTPDLFEDEAEIKFSRQEHRYKLSRYSVITRTYAFEDEAGPQIPQDLAPLCMALTPDMMEKAQPPFVLADFEANFFLGNKSEAFDSKAIIEELDELHKYASMSFRRVIKKDALELRK